MFEAWNLHILLKILDLIRNEERLFEWLMLPNKVLETICFIIFLVYHILFFFINPSSCRIILSLPYARVIKRLRNTLKFKFEYNLPYKFFSFLQFGKKLFLSVE